MIDPSGTENSTRSLVKDPSVLEFIVTDNL
jgi:hypothetical protein